MSSTLTISLRLSVAILLTFTLYGLASAQDPDAPPAYPTWSELEPDVTMQVR